MRNNWLFALGIIALFLWVATIIASGAGWNPFPYNWNFSNTGSFGDSFGPLSATMAAIAAIAAVGALRAQQIELSRLRTREQEQDDRDSKVDFERTFFQLLDSHQKIKSSIDIDISTGKRIGQDAFRAIISYFDKHATMGHENSWNETYKRYSNDLGHYFRFLYHMVRFIDRNDNVDQNYYMQLLRATLSESELVALSLNCAWGEGRDKFRPLVEKYCLLHSLSYTARKQYNLSNSFDSTAFERKEIIQR